MTEAHIQHQILLAWGAHPHIRFWRQNTGAAVIKGRLVRFGVAGAPDIIGLIRPHGRMFGIEVKTAAGRQSDEQKQFEEMMTAYGGLYILARSVEDVDAALAAAGVTR